MIRVLTILAAVVALAVSAAPASAGSNHPSTYGDPQAQTYLELNLETTSITSYQLDWEYWNPFGL